MCFRLGDVRESGFFGFFWSLGLGIYVLFVNVVFRGKIFRLVTWLRFVRFRIRVWFLWTVLLGLGIVV